MKFEIEGIRKALFAIADCQAGKFCKASWMDCEGAVKDTCAMIGLWDTLRIAADLIEKQQETIQRLESENTAMRSRIIPDSKRGWGCVRQEETPARVR